MVIWVPGGSSRPYACPISLSEKKGEKGYYIRKIGSNIRANKSDEKELFKLSEDIPFDDRPNMTAEPEDLNLPLINMFLHNVNSSLYPDSESMSIRALGEKMHILGGSPENLHPLNIGLLFFNNKPEYFFDRAYIDIVDKPDPTGKGMTEMRFTGPIDTQLRNSLNYIKSYVIKEWIDKDTENAEAKRTFNYPFPAIEEALTNAIYHKSYQIGEPITVTITPDKLEITSIPGPNRSISNEDLESLNIVSRVNRNRRIGDFLKELRLAEGRNTGIPTIVYSMKNNDSELPIFKTDDDRTYFTVILPVNKIFLKNTNSTKK